MADDVNVSEGNLTDAKGRPITNPITDGGVNQAQLDNAIATRQPAAGALDDVAATTPGATGLALLETTTAAAARTALNLGTAAVAGTADFEPAGAVAAATGLATRTRHLLTAQTSPDGNVEIYRTDVTATTLTRVTDDTDYHTWWPKPSPDGSRILFCRTAVADATASTYDQDYSEVSIWVMNADGTGITEIVPVDTLGAGAVQGTPNWHPNGRDIVFFGGVTNALIRTVQVDGTNLTSVAVTSITTGISDTIWSPDGTRIAFCYLGNVYTVAAAGGAATQITTDGGTTPNFDPAYSPDNLTIAYLTRFATASGPAPAGEWGIRTVSASGGGSPTTIINDGHISSKPSWADDGFLYFHRLVYGTDSNFQLAKIQADGSGSVIRLTAAGGSMRAYPEVWWDRAAVYNAAAYATAYATAVAGLRLLKTSNLSDLASAITARANLGLTIGTHVQAYSAVLAATTSPFTTVQATKLASIQPFAGRPYRVYWDNDLLEWETRPDVADVAAGDAAYDSKRYPAAYPPEDHLEGDEWHPFPIPDPNAYAWVFDTARGYFSVPGGPPPPPDPDPTPFPVLPGVVFTQAEINAWATGTEYDRLAATGMANVSRTLQNPTTQISLAQLAACRDDSVWAKVQAVLWAIDGAAPRLAAIEAYLDSYIGVTSWERNTSNETQRLNSAWILDNMTQAASIIGYVDTGFYDFLVDASWHPEDTSQSGATTLDWPLNPNWHASFAAAKLGIAALVGDTTLWATARQYFRTRLGQSIYHSAYDGPSIKPLRNDAGSISSVNTVNHWGGTWSVPQVSSPTFTATFPDGTNAERLRDHGHVCMSYGAWVHGARTILAQGEMLTAEEYDRLEAGINYHASRVLPYFEDGTQVAPWPTGNGTNGLGGGNASQSWYGSLALLGGDASADLIAICAQDEVVSYPPAGANHMVAERMTDEP